MVAGSKERNNTCYASPVNNQILFFGGHDSHFYDRAIRQMKCQHIQPFVLKSGNSANNQPNDNVPNAKLKSLYNEVTSVWMLKYGTKKCLPCHMNSILLEAWDAFRVSAGNIIREIFVKTKLPPPCLSQIDNKYPGMCFLHPSIFWIQGWINQKDITPHSCTY